MSKFGKACMRGVDHVTGTIAPNVDMSAAKLRLENSVDNTAMSINVTPAFFFSEKGSRLSFSDLQRNCVAIGHDYGFNKFALD